ncbi:MHYT domain-containing protein [Oceanicoccus sp. KOV_DT_Chl]|uniref:MHYT domain-containing protein n=1 Tax=Oceanicoccus sp. KOV_DT_Chl TaxID=1904639 RepID=UPI000C7E0D7D|nr:MHYT domain-containing protein [Oceanicoccus sp. KOV_DT_Chl]
MNWLSTIFNIPDDNLLVYGTYDSGLVGLSVALAIFASFMMFQNISLAAHINSSLNRSLAYAAAGISQGGGVWSMHFIGMLAFDLCTPVDYDKGLTLLSIAPASSLARLPFIYLKNLRSNFPNCQWEGCY